MKSPISVIVDITKILTEFALTKYTAQALEVKEAIQEGHNYRWRLVSTRFRDVVVVLETKKPLFRELQLRAIEVFGTTNERKLEPNLEDLRAYLQTAELVPVRR